MKKIKIKKWWTNKKAVTINPSLRVARKYGEEVK